MSGAGKDHAAAGSGVASLPKAYFDAVYAANRDPWNFETSPYERAKYDDSLRALRRPRYRSALEIGCSIGVLTERLAARCDALLSIDVSEAALAQARARCAGVPQVRFTQMAVPEQFPEGCFDLVVVSEVGYYWTAADQERAMGEIAAHQDVGAELLLVHWTPPVHDYPQTGDAVHERWLRRPEWRAVTGHRTDQYRLNALERLGEASPGDAG